MTTTVVDLKWNVMYNPIKIKYILYFVTFHGSERGKKGRLFDIYFLVFVNICTVLKENVSPVILVKTGVNCNVPGMSLGWGEVFIGKRLPHTQYLIHR